MDKKKVLLIGGIVVAVGIAAFLLYQRNKKKKTFDEDTLTDEEKAMLKSAGLGDTPSRATISSKPVTLKPNLVSNLKAV